MEGLERVSGQLLCSASSKRSPRSSLLGNTCSSDFIIKSFPFLGFFLPQFFFIRQNNSCRKRNFISFNYLSLNGLDPYQFGSFAKGNLFDCLLFSSPVIFVSLSIFLIQFAILSSLYLLVWVWFQFLTLDAAKIYFVFTQCVVTVFSSELL